MAKAKTKKKKLLDPISKEEMNLIGVDVDLGLYELTDLFHAFYKYHNDDCAVDFTQAVSVKNGRVSTKQSSLSRFQAFRRIEAARLGSRPYLSGKGIAKHKPNTSLGYMRLFMDYIVLPFKSIFTDSDLVKVRINKRQFSLDKLSKKDQEELALNSKNNPMLINNKEISDDVSDAYANIIRRSKKLSKGFDQVARKVNQDGLMAFVHSDMDWTPDPVEAIDLVTEPQAEYDPSTWSTFFVIKKMTAQEAVTYIRKPGLFWNGDALRWALESSQSGRGILDRKHYGSIGSDDAKVCGENFCVKSYYSEKSARTTNVGSYYGNMLVVEGYYKNAKGKVNKVIFFPSSDFLNVSSEQKSLRSKALTSGFPSSDKETKDLLKELEFADVLFHRENVFNTMQEAITVIPFDRSELSLERQRAYGHESFSPIEMVMRLDSSILNMSMILGVPFYKNRTQGTDAQDLLDLEINVNGDMQDLGDRDIIEVPFKGDINSLLAVRNVLLQHVASKFFLGGLDNGETASNGRGANLANLRLIRDGRIHKHTTEEFSKGLTDLFTKMFRRILDLRGKDLVDDDVLLQKTFFDVITKVHGHDEDIFKYDKEDIVPDTGLPYWMEIESIRNGASHFGAAELVLYSEIKSIFGDGLNQRALESLNRMGIKSMLGQQDALDILGDPKDMLITEKDQVYRATMENAAILGSVDSGTINFEKVLVLDDKDDHVAHLAQVHNVKANEIVKRLQENEVTPEAMQDMSSTQLDTRNNMILKLAALANHISLHLQNLERFGSNRPDINQLKEETNAILQASEGLMNSLQISLRILDQKKQEEQARLMNISPENEAEKMKQQADMQKLQASAEENKNKLMLANKIADQKHQQHVDKQLSKARDRTSKEAQADRERELKREELGASMQVKAMEIEAKKNEKTSTGASK